jgi:hypothetical protein
LFIDQPIPDCPIDWDIAVHPWKDKRDVVPGIPVMTIEDGRGVRKVEEGLHGDWVVMPMNDIRCLTNLGKILDHRDSGSPDFVGNLTQMRTIDDGGMSPAE